LNIKNQKNNKQLLYLENKKAGKEKQRH